METFLLITDILLQLSALQWSNETSCYNPFKKMGGWTRKHTGKLCCLLVYDTLFVLFSRFPFPFPCLHISDMYLKVIACNDE